MTFCAACGSSKRILPIVLHHHEAWDGSGYPSGLRAQQIAAVGPGGGRGRRLRRHVERSALSPRNARRKTRRDFSRVARASNGIRKLWTHSSRRATRSARPRRTTAVRRFRWMPPHGSTDATDRSTFDQDFSDRRARGPACAELRSSLSAGARYTNLPVVILAQRMRAEWARCLPLPFGLLPRAGLGFRPPRQHCRCRSAPPHAAQRYAPKSRPCGCASGAWFRRAQLPSHVEALDRVSDRPLAPATICQSAPAAQTRRPRTGNSQRQRPRARWVWSSAPPVGRGGMG